MFFRLAKDQDPRFPCHHQLTDQLWLSTDSGWQRHGDCVIKGYADTRTLAEVPGYNKPLRGNYCAFQVSGAAVSVQHDVERSFPMWRSDSAVTNLYPEGQQIWADKRLTVHGDMSCDVTRDITWRTALVKDDDELVERLHKILLNKFRMFLSHNQLPLKIFLTGGIDTTTVWAYLDHVGADYELVAPGRALGLARRAHVAGPMVQRNRKCQRLLSRLCRSLRSRRHMHTAVATTTTAASTTPRTSGRKPISIGSRAPGAEKGGANGTAQIG